MEATAKVTHVRIAPRRVQIARQAVEIRNGKR